MDQSRSGLADAWVDQARMGFSARSFPSPSLLALHRIQRFFLGQLLLHFGAVDGREDLFHPARIVKPWPAFGVLLAPQQRFQYRPLLVCDFCTSSHRRSGKLPELPPCVILLRSKLKRNPLSAIYETGSSKKHAIGLLAFPLSPKSVLKNAYPRSRTSGCRRARTIFSIWHRLCLKSRLRMT